MASYAEYAMTVRGTADAVMLDRPAAERLLAHHFALIEDFLVERPAADRFDAGEILFWLGY